MHPSNSEANLLDVLLRAADEAPEQVVVHVRGDGTERVVTFAELRSEALRVAGGLIDAGLAPGTPLPLVADRGEDFQPLFWGALAAGLIPVPLAPARHRVAPVYEHLGRPAVLIGGAAGEAGEALLGDLPGQVRALRLGDLRAGRPPGRLPRPHAHDVAFLQFSSGSTGAPKGVELTHAGVLANLAQIRAAAALTDEDVLLGWMPYFHDMGLIGTHLVPMAARLKQVRLEPLSFAKRPALWLETAARHRATVLSAANFALRLAVQRIPDSDIAALDLRHVRLLLVGAEPIGPRVWREFTAKTRPAGLDPRAPLPVYGLAEATLAVTFPPLGEVAAPLTLDRAALGRGRAEPTGAGPHAVELMDLGRPVPGCEVRVTDGAGKPLGERHVGHVEVRGPQLGRGYHRDPDATAAAFAGGWLRTGDLGFLNDGRLCVTGRHKDVVFVNGRTFHAPDLEEILAGTPGLSPGTVAVVGSTEPVTGAERVVGLVQWSRPTPAAAPVLRAAATRLREALGHDDVRVLPLPPGGFPRTTSGKLRRSLLRDRFEAGAYAAVEARVRAWAPASAAEARGPAAAGAPSPAVVAGLAIAGAPSPAEARGPAAAGDAPGAPRTRGEVEEAVLCIWARTLELPVDAIGPHDRFFALGGSSLKAMAVVAAVEETFGVCVEPRAVVDHDTVPALTVHLLGLLGTGHSAARDAAVPAAGPASASDSTDDMPGGDAVAVLSTACRFPGAATPEAFWDLLVAGRRPDSSGPSLDAAAFDAAFFGMDEEEARATDPQARLFLELTHEALERAGYAGPRRTGRRIGVFAAVGDSGYREVLDAAVDGGLAAHRGALTGNLPNLVAARVSHVLDLDGPALAVDTACSSALVALHLARRSLLSGECDLAVVGGVNLHLSPTASRLLEGAGALSPTGRCRPFGADADGFVPGEGGAAVVLGRLGDARRSDDPVLALVRATAVNNDGRSLSLLAPNPRTQREVIARAYSESGVDPAAVSYVEAHGTGTPVGDPVEARSLGDAFPPRPDGLPRRLGSVKANVGHLLNAAGMPALVKVVLALGHRQLPPAPQAGPPAPYLERSAPGFALVDRHQEWRAPGPLVAGVNAFGFGGTNAHAVLEEAPARPAPHRSRPPASLRAGSGGQHLLTLSAGTPSALRTAAGELAAHLRAHPALDEGDVCAAVGRARDDRPHRLALVAEGHLAERLEAFAAGRCADGVHASEARPRPRLVFLLPGQGARQAGAVGGLYRSAPVFREVVDEASAAVGPVLGRALAAWCRDAGSGAEGPVRTEVSQPLLVAYGVGLARQLAAWGITPDAVVGHSVGEIAAACVAGALTLPDAVAFAAERGRLMGEFALPGAMAAVRAGEEEAAGLVAASDGRLCVAAVNGPDHVVLAGPVPAVDRAVADLAARGVAARRLDVSHAFHSPLLEPALEPLECAAKAVTARPAAVPMLSTLTGRWQPELTPGHWRRHAVRPVLFGAAVARLLDEGYDTFVDLGPGGSLAAPVRAVAAGRGAPPDVAVLPAVRTAEPGSDPGLRSLLETVGRLWVRGVRLDRTALDAGRSRVPVPAYPFERERFWPVRRTDGAERYRSGPGSPHAPSAPGLTAGTEGSGGLSEAGSGARTGAAPVLHRPVWQDTPLTPARGPRTVRLAGATGSDLAPALAGRLAGRGVTVLPYDGPAHSAGAGPSGADTLVWLAGEAPELSGPHGDPDGVDAARHAAVVALRGILALLGPGCDRLLVVTQDVHVTGSAPERPRPAQALLNGFALALAEERPGLSCRTVDLSSCDPAHDRLEAVVGELYAETVPGTATPVAWRAGRRLSRTPQVVEGAGERRVSGPEEPPAGPEDPSARSGDPSGRAGGPSAGGAAADRGGRLPADGTYLITGGAGGLGSALARELARRGAPDLVLTGRAASPPRELLAELRALGARAQYRSADVSAEDDTDALVAGLPPLDGVFHAAGTVRPGSLRAKTDEEIERALSAKVRGTVLLAGALRRHGHRPAACVVFSSVASVVPGLAGALGDYAAANAFLDAFAAAERAAGRPWQAIGLGPVADAGMAGRSRALDHVAARGMAPLTSAAAVAGLCAALGLDSAHLLVTGLPIVPAPPPPAGTRPPAPVGQPGTPTLPARREPAAGPGARHEPGTPDAPDTADAPDAVDTADALDGRTSTSNTSRSGTSTANASTTADGVEAGSGVTDPSGVAVLVRRLLAEALHRAPEDIADDAHFLSLGLDSLTAVDLAHRLERELGLPLSATLLFEHRTLGELTDHLAAEASRAPLDGQAPPGPARQCAGRRPAPAAGSGHGSAFPLTPVQRAFHAAETLHEGVPAFGYVRQTVRGPLDAALLGRALALLAARHPMLRMRIAREGTPPLQFVAPATAAGPAPVWYEVREPDGGAPVPNGALERLERDVCNRPFDLTTEDPVRVVLVRETPGLAHVLMVVHHAAVDGFSLNVLSEDLWSLYAGLAGSGALPEPPAPGAEFSQYAALLAAGRDTARFADDQRYWRQRIAAHTADSGVPALPYDGDADGSPEPPLLHHSTGVGAGGSAALREVAAEHGVSLFHLMLAVHVRCLARWSGRRAVAVNVARAGREVRLPGIERLVGPLADTLPVFADVDPEEPVTTLARRLRRIWREAEAHASLSSPDLARLLPAGRGGTRALAEAGFSFSRFPVARGENWPVTVTPTAAATGSAATRLSLLCWEADGELRFSWNFPARLLGPATVERLAAEHLADVHTLVAGRRAAGDDGIVTGRRAAGGDGIVRRLLAGFRAHPGAVAVDGGDTTLTYGELDAASAALAVRLRAEGVRPGDLVGLLTEPGPDVVVGVVGILRSGAGWVPLDAAYPAARLRDQVGRTGARVVVCHAATLGAAAALDGVVTVMAGTPAGAPPVPAPPAPPHDPDAIAYVIFTSGSTGRPKGVPITHRSMAGYLDWALSAFGYGPGDRLAQTASLCFDASVRQVLAPLLAGATVVTLPRNLVRDPEALLDHVVRERVTVWSSVPTLWERLLSAAEARARQEGTAPDLSALRWVHVGGEVLAAAHVRRWFDLLGTGRDGDRPRHRISNLYGPTEATINATCHIIGTRPADDVRRLPIGRPVGGTDLMVVAEDGSACAPGEAGELLIAGAGLTPGYLGEPELTATAFVERDGRRWYRSGDRVLRRADGVLEFLGRLDDQVKVRGHRVEPGEIEAALLAHPAVARAAVLLADGRLAAYVEPRPGGAAPHPTEVRAFLGRTLPPYMLPGRIEVLGALPLTGTGKIDRLRLGRDARPEAPDGPGSPGPAGARSTDPQAGGAGSPDPQAGGAEASPPRTGGAGVPHPQADEAGMPRPQANGAEAPGPQAGSAEACGPRSGSPEASGPRDGGPGSPSPVAVGAGGRSGNPPSTGTERILARVWADLLETPDVRAEDDFFALGGDSILALELFARLREEVPLLPRPTAVFTHSTLRGLAAAIDAVAQDGPPPAPAEAPGAATAAARGARDDTAPYPLTPTQRGFLLAETIAPGSTSAWLARFRLSGPLRPEVFQQAVDVLVVRHPMLRTVFPAGARPPVQQELPASLRLPVDRETLPPGHTREVLEERVAQEARRVFEPWAWPLVRLRLFRVGPDEHVLVVHAHHLIGDGYSAALLARELLTAYDRLVRGLPDGLPPVGGTFRDHALRLAAGPRAADPEAEAYRAAHDAPYAPPVLRPAAASGDGDGDSDSDSDSDSTDVGAGRGDSGGARAFRTAGFTLDAASTQGLRQLAHTAGTTLYAPLLTAYYRALTGLAGRRDLVLGLAVTGRDDTSAAAHDVFGPFAEAVALRPSPPEAEGDLPGRTPPFREDLRRIAAETVVARRYGPTDARTPAGLPRTAQFFFTFLDFSALGRPGGGTLHLREDDADTALAPPPVGTDVFVAVRPADEGLRVTVRAPATVLTAAALDGFADAVRGELEQALFPDANGAGPGKETPTTAPVTTRASLTTAAPLTTTSGPGTGLDAALVGYLPAPRDVAAFAGLPEGALPREELRTLLFPEGRARLLEETTTPLGTSGFVCLPLFADELVPGGVRPPGPGLAALSARAVAHAASLGARSVSLAGVIPSLTGYGYDVLREKRGGPAVSVTTGHAMTTVSVVKTVHAALAETGRGLSDSTVAFVGCGSIGTSSLRLLLARSPRPPARLVLCDVPGSGPRLRRLAAELASHVPGHRIAVLSDAAPTLPDAVYEADVLVAAVSGAAAVIDVDRLRPGTIVVDDSFPHCFDTARALRRMSEQRDVLVVGGGLLSVGSAGATATRLAEGLSGLAGVADAARATRIGLPGTMASCRLESLLHAHLTARRPAPPSGAAAPPLIHGLVDLPHALAYWDAAEATGLGAAPLHLLDHVLGPGVFGGVRGDG
ncbi:amino acid adenylation domain-containing protein [Streptomyces sp. NPDC051310]|uniref:amino acid adenylation domain-containing protein n=1 Tax=Streptomyces sp. NPDC051310 TaxID=3365649 RepID=UPI00379722A8